MAPPTYPEEQDRRASDVKLAVLENRVGTMEQIIFRLETLTTRLTENMTVNTATLDSTNERTARLESMDIRNEQRTREKDADNEKDMDKKFSETWKKIDTLGEEIKDASKLTTKEIDSLSERIEALEKWKWIITGGAVVIGILLGKVDLVSKLLGHVIG